MKFRAILFSCCCLLVGKNVVAQMDTAAYQWANSVFKSLTDEERIAQLMVVRSSGINAKGLPVVYDDRIDSLVSQYNIGAICAFQGTPLQQAAMFNRIQTMAKTPVMITTDAEWGLAMRFAGVKAFPYQLTMGAVHDAELVYRVGKAIGDQCRRMNIHVNYAPVVDINNNPDNPVIGIRSFGEDKYKVALMGTRIMEGIQEQGVMACAKHFPGHGDVAVDSHYDLPVINKTIGQLDSLELFPFTQLFKKGVGSVMVAHLFVPAIDTIANQASSLSYKNVTELLRSRLGYRGLTFTDALEMKGVTKYYPAGEAAVQSLIAGNDMLCLPESVPQTIEVVKKAIAEGRLTWMEVNNKCMRVLASKYRYVVGKTGTIDTANLVPDLNIAVAGLRKEVAEQALTVLSLQEGFLPLQAAVSKTAPVKPAASIVYIAVGTDGSNELAARMKKMFKADVIALPYADTDALSSFKPTSLKKYKKVIIGLHSIGRSPARNFGIPMEAINLVNAVLDSNKDAMLLTFGNPYINKYFTGSKNLVACYEDDSIFQNVAANWLAGKIEATGTLPVTVGTLPFGSGIVKEKTIEKVAPALVQMDSTILSTIDNIALEAIALKATPGCVVNVLRNGKTVFEKSYGYLSYDSTLPVTPNTIYDLASVTKISATTVCLMRLVDERKIDLGQTLGYYLPWLKGSDKAGLLIENVLLHQAGLNPFIPFNRELLDKEGTPLPAIVSTEKQTPFTITMTDALYLRNDWNDTMFQRIKTSTLTNGELKYVYSDNYFILLAKLVQAVAGMPIDQYAYESFYKPMGMLTTRYRPFEHFAADEIAPTENEKQFRKQLIWGYVHDPGAAMFDNVAGHAGLFSNAGDLAKLYQMLLNGGVYNNKRYLQKETIQWFTCYHSPISRRGLGFDKPEKDNDIRTADKAYPSKSVSPLTYGHTGFTGTCVWVDPKYDLVYIFLSNRVNPSGGENQKLSLLNIRSRIQEIIYAAITDKD